MTKRGDRYTSDFIWNINWQEQLDADQKKLEDELQGKSNSTVSASNEFQDSGFLSFNRVNDVYNTVQDLSAQLRLQSAAAEANKLQKQQKRKAKFTNPPTQAETKRWQRGGKFGKRSVAIDPTNSEEDQEREAVLLAEKQRYQQLQFEFQLWTLALTAVSFSVTYSFYTKEVAASYLLGALGGFVYLRLLNRSVDGIGTFSVGSLAGQPRLLIPVILVLAFNRWNGLYADDFSLKLQLLPTLIGFFTYKGAVIARQSMQLFQEMTSQQGGQQKQVGQSQIVQDGEGGIQQAAELDLSARSVDRAFVKKILTQ
eukprot:TRINITY_DN996_c1_g1_i13.p2 TRINITY_DN996_c1_g1~~TRINITY_DN996_c1_g1_i13.p2  ORF type:complete len:339 (-),score=45.54 TRINITY_DN996_c1_g1_i13:413-1348(-)